ncbi:hypothetical protein C8J57DRAFT_1316238 [Mycena rebaudengoi]|nr:hypothetical protein C8J57DRAFT_1316238 [Mycena rebaudengoi]
MKSSQKRKSDSPHDSNKRIRLVDAKGVSRAVEVTHLGADSEAAPKISKAVPPQPRPQRRRINKLAPIRPFPTVPKSVSATGPQSAHKEGKNLICITRKTPLAAYLRRCKNAIINDGYKTLHLSAMGAAIPHLLQLAASLPPTLPFAADEVHTHITTGTVEVQDEILPEDEDEDITYKTRGKSTLLIVLKIGDGEFEGDKSGPVKRGGGGAKRPGRPTQKPQKSLPGPTPGASSTRVVVAEPEQDDMEM